MEALHVWKHKTNGSLTISVPMSGRHWITSCVHNGVEHSFRVAGKTKTLRSALRFCKEFMSASADEWEQVK